jgi:hypothetical protein
MFLKLSSQIEGQLREAYVKKYEAGVLNQSTLADRIGVDRSVINRRLTGKVNMTEESIADMVWGLEHDIEIKIFDPVETKSNHRPPTPIPPAPPAPRQISNAPAPAPATGTLGGSNGTRAVVAG